MTGKCKQCIELNNIAHQGQIDFLEKELQTAKEENEKLKNSCVKCTNGQILTFESMANRNIKLTQQNKQMREALKDIHECENPPVNCTKWCFDIEGGWNNTMEFCEQTKQCPIYMAQQALTKLGGE